MSSVTAGPYIIGGGGAAGAGAVGCCARAAEQSNAAAHVMTDFTRSFLMYISSQIAIPPCRVWRCDLHARTPAPRTPSRLPPWASYRAARALSIRLTDRAVRQRRHAARFRHGHAAAW